MVLTDLRTVFGFDQFFHLGAPVREPDTVHPFELPALLEDHIPLPGSLLLKNKSYLSKLYVKEKLPRNEIARRLDARNSDCRKRRERIRERGRFPFGFGNVGGKLVKDRDEQKVIRIDGADDVEDVRDLAAASQVAWIATHGGKAASDGKCNPPSESPGNGIPATDAPSPHHGGVRVSIPRFL